MSLAIGRQAMELSARLGSGSRGIVFFGGEPLLYQDLIRQLIAHGRKMERSQAGRFHFKLTTNGLLLDEEFLRYSLLEDILVAMSFDGVREAHDSHRTLPAGGPTYDVLLEKLRLLPAMRPYSSVLMVVNPDTARYLIVSPNYAASWQESDFAALSRQYEELAELYLEWTREGRKFYLSPFEVKLSSHINQHCYRQERCELARWQLSVDS